MLGGAPASGGAAAASVLTLNRSLQEAPALLQQEPPRRGRQVPRAAGPAPVSHPHRRAGAAGRRAGPAPVGELPPAPALGQGTLAWHRLGVSSPPPRLVSPPGTKPPNPSLWGRKEAGGGRGPLASLKNNSGIEVRTGTAALRAASPFIPRRQEVPSAPRFLKIPPLCFPWSGERASSGSCFPPQRQGAALAGWGFPLCPFVSAAPGRFPAL